MIFVQRHLQLAARRLGKSTRGVAMIEFALAAPIVLGLGTYGIEVTNLALAHMRVSQIASNLADTASRVGENSSLSEKQIRETDINDAMQAVRLQNLGTSVAENGRVILSSLERNAQGGQWVHWQRCLGRKNHVSSYGLAGDGATGTALTGMGESGRQLVAPPDSAVMFVEVVYDYQPIVSEALLGPKTITAMAAFLVRERRDLDTADNPSNPTPSAPIASCANFNP